MKDHGYHHDAAPTKENGNFICKSQKISHVESPRKLSCQICHIWQLCVLITPVDHLDGWYEGRGGLWPALAQS